MLIFVLLTTLFTASDLKQRSLDTAAAVETAIEGRQRLMGCMSEGVTVEQARLVFLKCVDNHPEELHLPAMKVLSNAMLVAFPCGADKGERR